MICEKTVRQFCCEDISLIENYNKAIEDCSQVWHCHHRLETDLGLSEKELQDSNRYFNVEAKYLVFMTPKEHKAIHLSYRTKGTHLTYEHKRKLSIINMGESHPFYGKHHTEEAKKKMRKPKIKYKWLTSTGEIREMSINHATRFHPDWKKIGEV